MFQNPADGFCADRAHGSSGSARRRRERRLRSWLRHERMTVAAELSAALHHSRDGGREQYVGLRAQKSDSSAVVEEVENETHAALRGQISPPPGERPAPLAEVAAPQGSTVARCLVDGGPTLTVPVLAGRAGEAVDSSALSFLLSQSLLAEQEAKEAEELEANLAAREQQLLEEVERLRTSPTRGARGSPVEAAAAWWSLAKLASKKKKKSKRRRKKKLPRGDTRPRMVLPGRRLQRNTWFVSSTFLRQFSRSSSVRGTRTLFLRPLVSGSLFFCASRAEHTMWNFLGDPFQKRSHIQRFLVRLWILIASVYRGFWVISHRLYVKVDSDPSVRSLCVHTCLRRCGRGRARRRLQWVGRFCW